MRIVVVANAGGTLGRFHRAVAGRLAERGHDVAFVVPEAFADLAIEGVRVVTHPDTGRAASRAVQRVVRDERPDALLASFGHSSAALVAAGRHGVPRRIVAHHTPTAQLRLDSRAARGPRGWALRSRLARIYHSADAVLCASTFTRADLVDRFRIPPDRIVLAPYGIDEPGRRGLRREPARLFLPGRYDPSKGHRTLLEALPLVAADHPDVALHLAGPGTPGPELRPLMEAPGAAGRVEVLGHLSRPELFDAYATATLVVVPSRAEGFGLVPVEAMTQGSPIVASSIPPFAETLGDAAVLLPPDDPRAWAAALGDLLGDGPRRELLGRAARRRYEQRWQVADRALAWCEVVEGVGRPTAD